MLTLAAEQSKRNMCIALMNRELHNNNRCPGNHEVGYVNGWFTIDGSKPFHRPDLTAEAGRLLSEGAKILYSSVYNSFVIH